MRKLLNKIVGKKVIIWGVGAIQTDMEALFPQIKPAYYVDDLLEEKGKRIPDRYKEKTFEPEHLLMEDKEKVFIIICEQYRDNALGFMDRAGFVLGDHYFSYERLLYEFKSRKFNELFLNSKIVVWGAGQTFEDYREYLEKMSKGISFLIDGRCTGRESVHGYEVLPPSEGMNRISDETVIVTSTYYPVILEELGQYGYSSGVNCLFADTFETLCSYYRRFDQFQYAFENRQIYSEKMLLVLAGYKKELWDNVFKRIKRFVPPEYDVCIASSGCYSKELSELCKENEWSYLSTKKNKISNVMNLAFSQYEDAEWIIKMDEDIFLTQNTIPILEKTYREFPKRERYEIGFVSPLIPVNTYGYTRFLNVLGKEKEWLDAFGQIKITDGLHHHKKILENAEAAKFLWKSARIDELSKYLGEQELRYSICPSRYSIGMILFSRELWIDMGLFPDIGENNLGMDEKHITEYCMISGKAMVIAENTVAGHLGYKEQAEEMMNYYKCSLSEEGEKSPYQI